MTHNYQVDPALQFGPRWKNQRPPGLPDDIRPAGITGSGIPYIASAIPRDLMEGNAFRDALLSLAQNESSLRMGLPASLFSPGRVHAWGVFQWNDGAMRRLLFTPRPRIIHAWTIDAHRVTAEEEVGWPIAYYAAIWRDLVRRGADARQATIGIRLWHKGPSYLSQFIRNRMDDRVVTAIINSPRTGRTQRDVDPAEQWSKHRNQLAIVGRYAGT